MSISHWGIFPGCWAVWSTLDMGQWGGLHWDPMSFDEFIL